MSPASKSKSKEKKAGKEPAKGSSKPLVHANTNNGIPSGGYNPLMGTFHALETSPVPSSSPLNVNNGRFRNIDDSDDSNGNLNGTSIEYDSVSNNGSWSGESEDHKEKTSQPLRPESVPGADNDKREKIRQKNERKHQRQKERRAQELHERCSGFLMSRKLEALAQQLVAMGFSHERATMALILNEGRVEESVAWLFEGGEEDKRVDHNLQGGGNLKIDITEELARIADMEMRYKASKQEVERAVVACEGDLEKAEETLKAQKQEPPATSHKPEETGDPPTVANSKLPMATSQKVQAKPTSPANMQQGIDDKDFNYTKVSGTLMPSLDPGTKSIQSLKKVPPKMEWAKPQQQSTGPAEKRWQTAASNPSASYSLTSTMQVPTPLSKAEAQYLAVGNELKNLQLGSVREPVTVMQRPHSVSAKQVPSSSVSSSPPGMTTMSWYPSSLDTSAPNGLVPPVVVSRSISPNGVSSNQLYNQLPYQPQQFMSNSSAIDSQVTARGNSLWNRAGASQTLSAASSLGLFSGHGSSGSTSPVDWSMGSTTLHLDYTNIDWSLDRGLLTSSRPNGLWTAANYSLPTNSTRPYESFTYGAGMGMKSALRPVLSNGSVTAIPGLQDGVAASMESAGGVSWEWTSPFEEKDIFCLTSQFVSSPSL